MKGVFNQVKKIAVVLLGLVAFLFISLAVLFLAVPSKDEPDHVKAAPALYFNQSEYQQLETKVIADSKGAIIKISRKDKLFDVTVPFSWYDLSDARKKEVATYINKKIRNIAIASELIRPKGYIDVMLIDPSGKELKY